MDYKKVIDYVKSQIGYEEPNHDNHNKYAHDIDTNHPRWYGSCGKKDGYDWCSVFVDDAFIQAYGESNAYKILNRPQDNLGAVVKYAYNYLDKVGRTGKNPQLGATIYFQNSKGLSHTGIVIDYDSSYVWTVEGNAGPGSYFVVKNKYKRSDSYIYGYGYPLYDAQPQPQPTPSGYTPGQIYKVTCKGPLRIRTSAETGSDLNIIDNLYRGDKVECMETLKDSKGRIWIRIDGWTCAEESGVKYIE